MIREKVEDYVRTIPDFPKEGIMFRDITTVLSDADGLKLAIDKMEELLADCDFDIIAGAESRGFIFGAALAYNMHKPFVLIRKKGIDDLIATGGTVEAAAELIEELGGEISRMVFLMELRGLNGRERLSKYDVASVISYEGK